MPSDLTKLWKTPPIFFHKSEVHPRHVVGSTYKLSGKT